MELDCDDSSCGRLVEDVEDVQGVKEPHAVVRFELLRLHSSNPRARNGFKE